MRKDITVAAQPRSSRGKNEARRMRVAGEMPAIIYGTGKDPVAVSVSPKEIHKILHSSTGHNTIFDVAVTGQAGEPVLIVDWQHHPVKGNLLHVDLMRIDLAKPVHVKVPVHVHGDARGVKLGGGMMEVVNREVEIECLPDDIPEFFDVDVRELDVNQGVRAGDLTLKGSMKLLAAADLVLVHVVPPRGEEAAAGEAAAEPEVVKAKGKKEEAAAGDKKKK